jgi:hypothetical protein
MTAKLATDAVRTVDQFNAAVAAYVRRMWVWMTVSVAGTLAIFGGMALLRERFITLALPEFGELVTEVLLGAVPLVAILVFLSVTWLGYRRSTQDPLLFCPFCDYLLAQNATLTVATKNCGRCGRRVLADPEPLVYESFTETHA